MRLALALATLAMVLADRRILEHFERQLNTVSGKVKRYRCIEEYVTVDNDGKESLQTGRPFPTSQPPDDALIVGASSSIRRKPERPISTTYKKVKRKKRVKKRREGHSGYPHFTTSTPKTTTTTTIATTTVEDPSADQKIEEMLRAEESGNEVTTSHSASNPIKPQIRHAMRGATTFRGSDDSEKVQYSFSHVIPLQERSRSSIQDDRRFGSINSVDYDERIPYRSRGYRRQYPSYEDYDDYFDSVIPLLRRRLIERRNLQRRRHLQPLPPPRTTMAPPITHHLRPITMNPPQPPQSFRTNRIQPLPRVLPPAAPPAAPPPSSPSPFSPNERMAFQEASAANCAKIPKIAAHFGIKDVQSWARGHCGILQMFARGATCQQIFYFIDSCKLKNFL